MEKKKKLAEENGKSLKTTFLAQEYAENTFLALKTTYFVNFFPKNQFLLKYNMLKYPYKSYFNRVFGFLIKVLHFFQYISTIFFFKFEKKILWLNFEKNAKL